MRSIMTDVSIQYFLLSFKTCVTSLALNGLKRGVCLALFISHLFSGRVQEGSTWTLPASDTEGLNSLYWSWKQTSPLRATLPTSPLFITCRGEISVGSKSACVGPGLSPSCAEQQGRIARARSPRSGLLPDFHLVQPDWLRLGKGARAGVFYCRFGLSSRAFPSYHKALRCVSIHLSLLRQTPAHHGAGLMTSTLAGTRLHGGKVGHASLLKSSSTGLSAF